MPLLAVDGALDGRLVSLFAGSAGPSIILQKQRRTGPPPAAERPRKTHRSAFGRDENGLLQSSPIADRARARSSDAENEDQQLSNRRAPQLTPQGQSKNASRKRKRKENEDLEDVYIRRVVASEAKQVEKEKLDSKTRKLKHSRVSNPSDVEDGDSDPLDSEAGDSESADQESTDDSATREDPVPLHETLSTTTKDVDIEKSSRTVFLGNVSISAITSKSARKSLLNHLTSFRPSSSTKGSDDQAPKVESLRFRSTAFFSNSIPKKAAYARKELMDATTKSTNAYVVYSTAASARDAAKSLNGTVVLDRHLRVDSVAHPSETDHRRCVFVGNLGFVDDESGLQAAEDEGKKAKKTTKSPSDVEEGLWRTFGAAGAVESVRVVRDPKTRVGKGFAYVQFLDANSVEAALLYHDKKFPPLLPRKLRVTRAKRIRKNAPGPASSRMSKSTPPGVPGQVYVPKVSSHLQSLRGRAGKLLGRAGAAQLDQCTARVPSSTRSTDVGPNPSVFEGHRASSRHGGSHGLKLAGSRARKEKPRTRSSKRGTAWKAAAGGGKRPAKK